MEQQKTVARNWMTLEELACDLGIGMTKAYAMAKENRLPIPALKVGREFRFSRVAYERIVDAGHYAPVEERLFLGVSTTEVEE